MSVLLCVSECFVCVRCEGWGRMVGKNTTCEMRTRREKRREQHSNRATKHIYLYAFDFRVLIVFVVVVVVLFMHRI